MKIDFIFLLKAIKESENIFIYRKEIGQFKSLRFFSRFFQVNSADDSITIDLPYVDGFTHKHLNKGDEVSVIFNEAGFRFQFESEVLDQVEMISGNARIPALKITWPWEILDGNRRSLFRAAVYMGQSITASYRILRHNKEPDSDIEFDSTTDYHEGIDTLMVDISESGTAIKMNRKINVTVGDRLRISFQLEMEKQRQIHLEGIVRHIRVYPGSDVHLCGIEFFPKEIKHYKKVLKEITCYSMSVNRENVTFFTVNKIVSVNPYVQKIVDHEVTEEVLEMLLSKELQLTEQEFLESLVYVAEIPEFKERAIALLKVLSAELKEDYLLRMDANHKVAYFILNEAIENMNLWILGTVIQSPYLPVAFLNKIALRGTPRMLRLLLVNKIKLIAYPETMDIMEENPRLPPQVKEKIDELRNSYMSTRSAEKISIQDAIDSVTHVTAEEWKREGLGMPVPGKPDSATKKALALIHKINTMSLQQRIKKALTGSRTHRLVLARDSNPYIIQAVAESPQISEEEIIKLIHNPKTPRSVIIKISQSQKWARSYSVRWALVQNLHVPFPKVSGFVKRLKTIDLEKLINTDGVNPLAQKLAKYFLRKRN